MSIAETQAAKDKVRSLESQVIAARARIRAEQANLNLSDANIEAASARKDRTDTQQHFNRVLAPFDGVITERNVDTGTLITGGSENSKTSLYRVARIDTVKVFVEVPQYAATGIKVGQEVVGQIERNARSRLYRKNPAHLGSARLCSPHSAHRNTHRQSRFEADTWHVR